MVMGLFKSKEQKSKEAREKGMADLAKARKHLAEQEKNKGKAKAPAKKQEAKKPTTTVKGAYNALKNRKKQIDDATR